MTFMIRGVSFVMTVSVLCDPFSETKPKKATSSSRRPRTVAKRPGAPVQN